MKSLIRKYWRLALFITVLLTAFVAFLLTDMPSRNISVEYFRYFKALYFAASLFVFGGIDVGFPQGGPTWVLNVLWFCFFFAPILTFSYVYTVVEEKIFNKLPLFLKKHTVILGMGRSGKFMFDVTKNQKPEEKIVIVDRNLQNPSIPLYEKARSVWWVRNDFENEKALQKAKVHKATRIFITTNNDLVNLQTALKCLELNPGLQNIFCHLQNYTMHEDFTESMKKIPEYKKIVVFNAYTSAAAEVLKMIRTEEAKCPVQKPTLFVFLGFGHFGHTLFDDLIAEDDIDKEDEILIVTTKLKFQFDISNYDWAKNKKIHPCTIHPPIYKDIFSAAVWDEIHQMADGKDKKMVIVNCLDNDEANISLAVQIKKNGPSSMRNAHIYCRTYKEVSSHLHRLLEMRITQNEEQDIIPFSIENAMKKAYSNLLKTTTI